VQVCGLFFLASKMKTKSIVPRFKRFGLVALLLLIGSGALVAAQNNLTPLQQKIEAQRQRLSSADAEERRDALMKLRTIKHPDASRAATAALNDEVPMVRVSAAHAILWLPADEVVTLLTPLLVDKLEFVRREVAYALGETHSRSAVTPLANLLNTDKEVGVRAAAAVALGQIGDETAVPALAQVISANQVQPKKKARENEFVVSAAAESLGKIRSRAGVSPLLTALANEANPLEVRRASATALGLIGDQSAVPALQAAYASDDPYLHQAAREALRRLRATKTP
jgi:HEAT repeat protein